MPYLDRIDGIAKADAHRVKVKDASYKGSWMKRGGVGAFMMLARKWDRIEPFVQEKGWDLFLAIEKDFREEPIIQDIRDLRQYLMLVEAEMIERGHCAPEPTGEEVPTALPGDDIPF